MASSWSHAIAQTRDDHFERHMPDAARIAPIRHRIGKPPAHPELALGRP
jgi:hypothetical protein